MKNTAKSIIVSRLARQVRRLYKANNFKVVAVSGSIGKTSTKLAIAKVLSESFKVQFQDGNYNDLVSVPLIFFGQPMPELTNPLAWYKLLKLNNKMLKEPYPYDIVVVELGTDGPGQLQLFEKYLKADITVVTGLAPEHMEYFDSLDKVAKEELSVASYSDELICNADLCPDKYTQNLTTKITYGFRQPADYTAKNVHRLNKGFEADIYKGASVLTPINYEAIAEEQLYSALAAAAVGDKLGMTSEAIGKGISKLKPVSGRMQILKGINASTIIDDTYNASPDAVLAALRALYSQTSAKKIAILGNMNELGSSSEESHTKVGKFCDPSQLSLVVTIGKEANQYLAKSAEDMGCRVERFDSPYEAGLFLRDKVEGGMIILAKGSQNGVFAEEAVKLLLADPKDEVLLVRQSAQWMKVKNQQFGSIPDTKEDKD